MIVTMHILWYARKENGARVTNCCNTHHKAVVHEFLGFGTQSLHLYGIACSFTDLRSRQKKFRQSSVSSSLLTSFGTLKLTFLQSSRSSLHVRGTITPSIMLCDPLFSSIHRTSSSSNVTFSYLIDDPFPLTLPCSFFLYCSCCSSLTPMYLVCVFYVFSPLSLILRGLPHHPLSAC